MNYEAIKSKLLEKGWHEGVPGIFMLTVNEVPHDTYIERHEKWWSPEFSGGKYEPQHHKCAYALDGSYIGELGDRSGLIELIEKHGITPQRRTEDSRVASVGKDKNGRFWGWSHRAIHAFPTLREACDFAESVASVSPYRVYADVNGSRDESFRKLADAQRGEPERAMLAAQRSMGGGVLNVLVEHVGDLTHRMSEFGQANNFGYEFVKEKVDRALRYLRSVASFENEHADNLKSNAEFKGIPLDDYKLLVDKALTNYARAHQRLRVYNDAQRYARNAAIALGHQDFDAAKWELLRLDQMLVNKETWNKAAGAFNETSELHMSTSKLARRLKATAETNDKRDVLLINKGNVAYRMESLLRRRRNASLAGQHRETQRLDKEIMLLRAALGMPHMPPEEVVRTQRLAKDPVNGENLAIGSADPNVAHTSLTGLGYKSHKSTSGSAQSYDHDDGHRVSVEPNRALYSHPNHVGPHASTHAALEGSGYRKVSSGPSKFPGRTVHKYMASSTASVSDFDWMKRVTARAFAKIDSTLHSRGYEYSSKTEGELTHHTWKGFYNSQPDSLTITMIGRNWAVAAVRNDHRIAAFDFTKSDDVFTKGIPMQMTASQWDGTLDAVTKQAYANSWAKIVTEA